MANVHAQGHQTAEPQVTSLGETPAPGGLRHDMVRFEAMKHGHGRPALAARFGAVPLILSLALGAAAPIAGCAGEPVDRPNTEQVGSLGLELDVASDVTLNSVSYTIVKGDFTETGSIDVGDSLSISGTIGGIPPGDGYTITLWATSLEDETIATGSASFDVVAGETASAKIHLQGARTSGNGTVASNAPPNRAPVVDALTVTSQTVFVGSSVTLEAAAKDPDLGPSPLSYYWSTSEGVIDHPIDRHATLTSAIPGTATITLTVSDGDNVTLATTAVTFVEREAPRKSSGATPERPNILLIIADDVGAESVSLYPDLVGKHGAVPIPSIEELAENGLVFDNAWASPACSMARAMIVTGQFGHRTGVTYVDAVLPTDTVTVFDRIAAESPTYGQALFGKYHLAGTGSKISVQHVADIGVPTFRGILRGTVEDYYRWPTDELDTQTYVNTTYTTTAITDFAIDYIAEHEATRPNDPWFVYQAYNAAHAPRQVPPADLHSIDLEGAQPGQILSTLDNYKAVIQSMDTSIGRLLAEVDLEETTVIFTSDNGTPKANKDTGAGVRDSKKSVYEGGVRVPLIVAGAGVTRQGREDALVSLVDLYATILSLAGQPVSQVENSFSIEPLLSDAAATSGRKYSFTETQSADGKTQRYALRDTRYKLVSNNKVRELYDLVDDPLETTDLYSSAKHAAVRADLEAKILRMARRAPDGYFP